MTPRRLTPNPSALSAGGTRRTDPPEGWFVAKVTAIPSAGEYQFAEWHLVGDMTWEAKSGGRVATSLNPGIAIDGTTFAVGDFALVRAGPSAGGNLWEMLPIGAGATAREITYVSSVCPTIVEGVVTGITVERRTVTVLATTTVADPVCEDDPTDCCPTTYDCVDAICTEVVGTGGEYADLAACLAADPPCETPVEVVCCDGYSVPRRLTLTITSACADPEVSMSFELVYDRPPTFGLPNWDNTIPALDPTNRWTADVTYLAHNVRITLDCVQVTDTVFSWDVYMWGEAIPAGTISGIFGMGFTNMSPELYTCNPLAGSSTDALNNFFAAGGIAWMAGCSTESTTVTLTE